MDKAKQQVIDTIRSHSNILVTVGTDPTVDELSAALGLTIMLNNLDKRATSIYSGATPPAISFLEPEKTFETSADSLRDFIIALDKEKADHLRYKVEGEAVRIFITPYKTKLTEKDLEFSQGDYNVELVIALDVRDQAHLDKALEAHGKILHDAAVLTITQGAEASTLGTMDWHDEKASSLSEMIASLAEPLKEEQSLLDQQTSTALLTGIVSATDRFSNDKTNPQVMSMAAQLMAAGANQQLIAAKLAEGHAIAPTKTAKKSVDSSNELTIEREPKDAPPKDEVITAAQPPDQAQFEKQLAGVIGVPVTGTMADIEQQLQEATNVPPEVPTTPPPAPVETPPAPPAEQPTAPPVPEPEQPPVPAPVVEQPPVAEVPPAAPPAPVPEPVPPAPAPAPEPLVPELPTASKDTEMPGFEPTGDIGVPPPQFPAPAAPEEPVAPPATGYPEIIKQHGMVSPPSSAAPLNSISTPDGETSPPLNPFDAPVASQETAAVEPLATPGATNMGTPEGAALLASSEPIIETPAVQAAPVTAAPVSEPAAPSPISVPELPPLPPMPTDTTSLPPLPPPPAAPPVPSLGQDLSLPPMPSGAVSGDIFGDAAAAPAPAPAPAASEPGMFKIPGQS